MKLLYDAFSTNPLFVGGFGLIVTGILSYWMKAVPLKVWNFFIRTFTTSLSITNHHKVFYDILRYIEINYKHRTFRSLKVNNGMWGNDDTKTISLGYGVHYIKFNNTYLRVDYNKLDNHDREDKEMITMTKLGRKNKIFIDLIASSNSVNPHTTKLYKFEGHGWDFVREIKKRNFDSIYMEESKKNLIISALTDFKSNEEWYVNNGIPYQLGVLLKGPPGTGKTSIIKALAAKFDLPIYYISVSQISNIQAAFSEIPDNVLVVIEDIDGAEVTHNRAKGDNKETISKKTKPNNEGHVSFSLTSISEVLNAIDGIFAPSGRVLIMTTNRPEILDDALVRPGRIDYSIEIGYVNKETLKCFMDKFFPNNNIDYEKVKLIDDLTPAVLQNYVQSKLSAEQIIEKVSI